MSLLRVLAAPVLNRIAADSGSINGAAKICVLRTRCRRRWACLPRRTRRPAPMQR